MSIYFSYVYIFNQEFWLWAVLGNLDIRGSPPNYNMLPGFQGASVQDNASSIPVHLNSPFPDKPF